MRRQIAIALATVMMTAAVTATALFGCSKSDPPAPSPAAESTAPAIHVAFVKAPPDGDVATTVQSEIARAKKDKTALMVYVGAAWCEPCTRFHVAAEGGQLDRVLPPLRFLEFDLDRDRDRLKAAGYGSKMIPLLALPAADGTASKYRMEGSVKGPEAIGNMSGRLLELLAKMKSDGVQM